MNTFFKGNRKIVIFLTIAILLLVFLSFYKSLDFYFWRDDWDLWSQKYYFWKILYVHNHPGTWVSRAVLFHIFGWDRFSWQFLGLVLRIVSSIAVAALIFRISKSIKVGIIAGIFSAVSILGMETVTWASVYIIPQIIILNCLAFYNWILFVEEKSYKYAISSFLFISIAILADPGRTIFIIPIIVLWEVLNWWISSKKENFYRVLIRGGLFLGSLVLFMRVFLSVIYGSHVSLLDNFKYMLSDPKSFTTLLSSIGNLLLGWVNSPWGSSKDYSSFAIFIMITLLLIGSRLVILKKSRFGLALLLFTFWIPLTYIPNWLANKSFSAPVTDHYLAVSAIGYLGILALFVSLISARWLMYLVVLSFVFFNIQSANRILVSEASFRSYKIIEPYFDQIEREIPKDEKNSIFMYFGNDNAKYVDLDWSGSLPFGIKRGLTKYEDFPITTSDNKLILKLLCEDNVYRPSMFDWIYQEKRIPLSHLHAWELNGGILKNISVEQRRKFKEEAKLNNCIID